MLCRLPLCIGLVALAASGFADEPQPLTTAQKAAAAQVTQQTVKQSLLFLASDEMKGRDTPSTELTIAEAFVAAQFSAFGLEGLGTKDGSFFHTHNLPMSAPPESPARLKIGNQDVPVLGMMSGGPKPVTITATVTETASEDKEPSIVVIKEVSVPPQAVSNKAMLLRVLATRLRTTPDNSVVLMKCAADSPWVQAAQSLQSSPVTYNKGRQPEIPVLLISEDAEVVDSKATVSVAERQMTEQPVRNVVGVLRGSDETLSKEAIIVSAHLDHIGIQNFGPDTINNGADDNATGVTAVINMAKAFTALPDPPRRSVIFMTFWGEEKGLLGSKNYADSPTWAIDKIVANVNIEMVGRPEKDARFKAWMTGWRHSNLGELMHQGANRIGVEVFNRKDVGEMLYTRSDNYSFVQQGIVAHSFSAGSLHSDYHQPSDEVDKIDFEHMTKVIQGLFAGTLFLADGDVKVEKRK